MLSSYHQRYIIRMYVVSMGLLIFLSILAFEHYNDIEKSNKQLALSIQKLLLEKARYGIAHTNNTMFVLSPHVTKEKIIAWANQSQVSLTTLQAQDKQITIVMTGDFSQEIDFLISVATAPMVFDVTTIEWSEVNKKLALQLTLACQ